MTSDRALEVLLVEDDPGDVDLTREALDEGKVKVSLHVVDDGEKAIEYLHKTGVYAEAQQPDLILLDLNLPRKDGRDVLREIKSDESLKMVPVIVLTTSESDADILKTYRLGANSYVTKPVGFEQFKKVMKAIEDFWFSVVRFASPANEWMNKEIKVLMIEDDAGDVDLLWELLSEQISPSFEVECVNTLEKGMSRLDETRFDIVLLDLSLPDSQGLNTLSRVYLKAPKIPIVIMTGLDDEMVALEAVRKGAQDYLIKGKGNGKMLSRVMRYAIARHRVQSALQSLSLLDELTGLYNRRGFMSLAEQHLKLAHRTKKELLVVLADVDGLKRINDTFGHKEGDLALIKTAQLLRSTFRESDVLARIGGDEFAILAIDVLDGDEEIIERLREHIDSFNARRNRSCPLMLSVGTARFDPQSACSLEDLMAIADKGLYEQKKKKQKH